MSTFDRRTQQALVPQLLEGGAQHDPGCHLGQRHPCRLGHEGNRAAGPRVGLDDEHLAGLHRVLHVDRSPDVEGVGDRAGVALDHLDDGVRQRRWRDHTGAVTGVDTGFLDVLHHASDDDLAGRVANGVDVDLDSVLEEPVDEHRTLGRQSALLSERAEPSQLGHRPPQAVVVVDDLHGPPAQDVGRANEGGIADAGDDDLRVVEADGRAARRLRDLEAGAQGVPSLAVLGQVDGLGAGARHQICRQAPRQLQGRLASQRDDHGLGSLDVEHVEHILEGEGLEVETVARVVVRRDRLGVAVDHDRLVAGVVKGEAGVHTAVVELDALADAVRPRAEDDDLAAVGGRRLVFLFVGRIEVRRVRDELGGARVDGLERGADAV